MFVFSSASRFFARLARSSLVRLKTKPVLDVSGSKKVGICLIAEQETDDWEGPRVPLRKPNI